MSNEPLDDLRRASDPAATRARRDDLGEGVEAEDAAGGVKGEEGGDEVVEKVWNCTWLERLWNSMSDAGDEGLHLKKVVGLVFEDVEIVLFGDGVNGLSSSERLGRRCWILACRDGIDDKWFGSASCLLIPG